MKGYEKPLESPKRNTWRAKPLTVNYRLGDGKSDCFNKSKRGKQKKRHYVKNPERHNVLKNLSRSKPRKTRGVSAPKRKDTGDVLRQRLHRQHPRRIHPVVVAAAAIVGRHQIVVRCRQHLEARRLTPQTAGDAHANGVEQKIVGGEKDPSVRKVAP